MLILRAQLVKAAMATLLLGAGAVASTRGQAQAVRTEAAGDAGVDKTTEAQPLAAPPPGQGPTDAQVAEPRPQPPRLLHAVAVELPQAVAPPPGPLDLILTIDVDGHVSEVEFRTPADPGLEAVVRRALEQYAFEPARRGDEPLASRVGFRLEVDGPEEVSTSTSATGLKVEGAVDANAEAESVAASSSSEPSYGAWARVEPKKPGAATQIKLRGAELTHIPGTFGEPLRVVGALPGVARSPFGFGFYVVRGASFQNSGFYLDGFAVPLLYHLGAGPAIIPSRLVDQLDFYPGGYPLEYGRYSAGVIGLTTRVPRTPGPQVEFELDFLRASALAIAPFAGDKGRVAVGFRRSYYELILPLITEDVQIAYTDYQLRLEYDFTRDVRASVFVFGSRDFLDFELSTGAGATTGSAASGLRYAFDQVIASLEWDATRHVRMRWSGIAGPTTFEVGSDGTGGGGSFGADTRGMRLGQRFALRFSPSSAWTSTLGVHQNTYRYDLVGDAPSVRELPGIPQPGPPTDSVRIEDSLWELAVAPYVEQVLRLSPVELTFGLRADYLQYGVVRSWTLDPRGVVRLRLLKDLTLKAASGVFTQPPLPFQISVDAANPDLRPNRAWQSSVGLELLLPASVEVDSSVFYNRMWHLSRATVSPELSEDGSTVAQRFFADDGRGRSYGWELLVRRRLESGLFGWLSYTLSRSERYLNGGAPQVFFYDQTHVLNLAASYVVGGFRFGAKLTLSSGRPVADRLDPEGERTTFDADAGSFTTATSGFGLRLPLFHQLDVRIDRDFRLGPVEGSVYLDVLNVYNSPNSEGFQYAYDNARRGRLPGMPFLPTLGIRGVVR